MHADQKKRGLELDVILWRAGTWVDSWRIGEADFEFIYLWWSVILCTLGLSSSFLPSYMIYSNRIRETESIQKRINSTCQFQSTLACYAEAKSWNWTPHLSLSRRVRSRPKQPALGSKSSSLKLVSLTLPSTSISTLLTASVSQSVSQSPLKDSKPSWRHSIF